MKKSWMCFKLDPGTSEKGLPDSPTKIKVVSDTHFDSKKKVEGFIKLLLKPGVYFAMKVYIREDESS